MDAAGNERVKFRTLGFAGRITAQKAGRGWFWDTRTITPPLAAAGAAWRQDADLPPDSTELMESLISESLTRHWGQSRCVCRAERER